MDNNKNNPPPFEKYKKEISQNKKIKRIAIVRGLFFLFLCAIITYIGKFRPETKKTVSHHGLLLWVFKQGPSLSSLIIYPNDGDYQNLSETGERVFINPLASPDMLESSHIRYNQKDLYLLGRVNELHIKNYCTAVDSQSLLYYQGPSTWKAGCSKARNITAKKSRLTRDWSVPSEFLLDSLSGTASYALRYQNQKMLFFIDSATCKPKPGAILNICHEQELTSRPLVEGVILTPNRSLYNGKDDSALVITQKNQALGVRLKKSGELVLKKIWL